MEEEEGEGVVVGGGGGGGGGRGDEWENEEQEDQGCYGHFQLSPSLHSECFSVGLSPLVIPPGTVGVVSSAGEGVGQVVSWCYEYSAWNLFAAMATTLLHTPGVGVGECEGDSGGVKGTV